MLAANPPGVPPTPFWTLDLGPCGYLNATCDHRGAILGSLGRTWGLLGPILGPSWAFLGPSWGYLGTTWARAHLGLRKSREMECVDLYTGFASVYEHVCLGHKCCKAKRVGFALVLYAFWSMGLEGWNFVKWELLILHMFYKPFFAFQRGLDAVRGGLEGTWGAMPFAPGRG